MDGGSWRRDGGRGGEERIDEELEDVEEVAGDEMEEEEWGDDAMDDVEEEAGEEQEDSSQKTVPPVGKCNYHD